jgi:hypothetical protein
MQVKQVAPSLPEKFRIRIQINNTGVKAKFRIQIQINNTGLKANDKTLFSTGSSLEVRFVISVW